MREIRHVLFATSLSEACASNASYIQDFTRRLGAHLTIAHVFDPDVAYFNGFELNYRPVNQVVSDCAERSLLKFRTFLDHHCSGLDYSTLFVRGNPLEEIAEACRTRHVDLLMLPRDPHSRLRSLYHESTLARMLENTSCAVWTTCHTAIRAAHGAIILCGIDFHGAGGPDAEQLEIADTGRWLADRFQARLSLAHVACCGEIQRGDLRPDLREVWHRLCDRVHADERHCLGTGRVTRTLCEFAREQRAALLIIGRSHSASFFGETRPKCMGIVREAPCPVVCAAERTAVDPEPARTSAEVRTA